MLMSSISEAATPNIVLILADDLGFTDIQPFASEISTPSLAALAENGIRFTNHHVAASCAPTRAMLLTGVDSHLNGVPNIPEAMPPSQLGRNGYDGVLSHQVQTVATLLRDRGYHTYVSGKWHLGKDPSRLPNQRGFERSVILAESGADNWSQRPYLPMYRAANWYKDDQPHQLPEKFYSSEYIVDQAIEQIDSQHGDGQAFFSYLAFQAVHIPVQAPAEFRVMYEAQYQQGWSALRQQRYRAAVAAGLVSSSTTLLEMDSTADWDALTEDEQRDWARRMAVYAAMVQAMDHHIGRFVEYLKSIGEYDNTVFVFMSDNGPEPADPVGQFGLPFVLWMKAMGYNTDYETLGEPDSYVVIGPSFASAAASPLSYYKYYAGEGGLRVPMIIAGAGVEPRGQLSSALTHVTDIVPTLLELGGASMPGAQYRQPTGKSLLPLLLGQDARRGASGRRVRASDCHPSRGAARGVQHWHAQARPQRPARPGQPAARGRSRRERRHEPARGRQAHPEAGGQLPSGGRGRQRRAGHGRVPVHVPQADHEERAGSHSAHDCQDLLWHD